MARRQGVDAIVCVVYMCDLDGIAIDICGLHLYEFIAVSRDSTGNKSQMVN